MIDVVLVTNYWHFAEEKDSSRYFRLAALMAESGIRLEVITSDFYHATKARRHPDAEALAKLPYKVTLLNEVGYKKNISLQRLRSNRSFAKNTLRYLRERSRPDIIYSVVPPLHVADAVGRFAKDNAIPLAIDIQDLWPEAFRMALDVPLLSDLIFLPMRRLANRIYSRADVVFAVSETYVQRALSTNHRAVNGHAVYLGVDLDRFDKFAESRVLRDSNEIWLGYVGTLSYSYDLRTVISAMALLRQQRPGLDVRLIVMGDGPLSQDFQEYASLKRVRCTFTGNLKYSEMVRMLSSCDIAVNPIVGKAAQSIINKHADYFAAGLPVLNTQESPEYQSLLTDYRAGFNCRNEDAADLAEKLNTLCVDPRLREAMGKNSRAIAESRFDRGQTYSTIVDQVKAMAATRIA